MLCAAPRWWRGPAAARQINTQKQFCGFGGRSLTQRVTLTELANDTSAAARMAAAAHDLQKENRRFVVR
jgi:hypothetical protein